jgi:hypothetical protein
MRGSQATGHVHVRVYDALALLRLQSARASDAHVNRIGGRKAFINLLLSAV